jgi:outer membrane murein-binding lipoprotein Lpp
MVRRLVAAGVGIVVVIVAVLLISGCLKSQKQQSLKNYNRDVSELAQESEKVSQPLFVALTGASAKQALDVEQQIDELLKQAQAIAARAGGLSVPGEMVSAQRDLLLALDLRVEGMTKVAALVSTALGGQAKQASTKIAGDMELFLASDVIYSQRVVPLIQQTLSANGVSGLGTTANRFLPNIGWLEASTTLARITGQTTTGSSETGVAPGHHGSVLKGVSVGTQTLEVEPALNHVSGGGNPTFTAMVEDDGEFPETDVTVDVTVTVAGKTIKASHVIDRTEPGKTVNVEVPVPGIPTGLPAKVEVAVQPVPGETNHEGTKNAYLVSVG